MSASSSYVNGHMYMPGNPTPKILRPILPAPHPSSLAVQPPESSSLKSPRRPSGMEQKRRQKKRSGSKKIRDADYWRRVYESPILTDDDKHLVQLKIIKGLSWKEIQSRFNKGKALQMQQPALQMRLNRLAEKMDSLWAQAKESNLQTAGPSFYPAPPPPTLTQPTYWPMNSVYLRDSLEYCEGTPANSVPMHVESAWSRNDLGCSYFTSSTSTTIGVCNTPGSFYCPDQSVDQYNDQPQPRFDHLYSLEYRLPSELQEEGRWLDFHP